MQVTIFAFYITEMAIRIITALCALICSAIKIAVVKRQLKKDSTNSTPQTNETTVDKDFDSSSDESKKIINE